MYCIYIYTNKRPGLGWNGSNLKQPLPFQRFSCWFKQIILMWSRPIMRGRTHTPCNYYVVGVIALHLNYSLNCIFRNSCPTTYKLSVNWQCLYLCCWLFARCSVYVSLVSEHLYRLISCCWLTLTLLRSSLALWND